MVIVYVIQVEDGLVPWIRVSSDRLVSRILIVILDVVKERRDLVHIVLLVEGSDRVDQGAA